MRDVFWHLCFPDACPFLLQAEPRRVDNKDFFISMQVGSITKVVNVMQDSTALNTYIWMC